MKSLLASIVFFSATSSFACPQLSGEYSCKIDNDTVPLKVDQRIENHVDIYKVNFQGIEQEFITDGQSRTTQQAGEKLTYSAVCGDNQIAADVKTESDGAVMLTKLTVNLQANRDVKLTYEIKDPNSSDPATKIEVACKRVR
jgi:hypothetical protein